MNHASVFSGIGGAEVAASWMGWNNVFHCEINSFSRKVLDYWFPNSVSYEDITKTDFTCWRDKVDVLTGGFPCQPFSVAGSRKGETDDRYLWPHMLRAIGEILPTWVVAENVAGIATMVQSCGVTCLGRTDHLFEENYLYREEFTFTLDTICNDIERAGYKVQPIVIPACAVGAPHRRDRIWIVANRANPRVEEMQQDGKDGILSDGTPSNSNVLRHGWGKDKQEPFTRRKAKTNDSQGCQDGDSPNTVNWREGRNFARFPTTQSTLCGGDDGLPFNVDDLAISKGKWRAESIKAYGNAWVPQVAYEIFKAIEVSKYLKTE